MKKKITLVLTALLAFSAILGGCGAKEKTLKVAATSIPHGEILEFIKPDLQAKGIVLEIIDVQDYTVPNRALDTKEVDANFFQHYPYMNKQIADFDYKIQASVGVHIEPMGFYSQKIQSIDDLKEGAVIAVPNDGTNEARALVLLHNNGIIELDDPTNEEATVLNIVGNPKNIKVQEIDAAMLSRTLQDVDGAVINSNYAMEAGLIPTDDSLIIESSENNPFVNILTIRTGDENREDLKTLAEILTSNKVKQFIQEKYQGAIVPAF